MADRQRTTFLTAIDRLAEAAKSLAGNDQIFLQDYHRVRQNAFAVEFLAKFYRKSLPHGKKHFTRIVKRAKALEDRLGRLDEIDALIPLCAEWQLMLKDKPAAEYFRAKRDRVLLRLRDWLNRHGWLDGKAVSHLRAQTENLKWRDDDADLEFTRRHIVHSLKKLQAAVEHGRFDPRHRRGYRLSEVEPRVHKLRREIRKQAQFMAYAGGLFALTDRKPELSKPVQKAYGPLLRSPFAKDQFAQLPPATVEQPIQVPRVLFLAVNRYVSELGSAKDWAYTLERLERAGIKGKIDFDQLDVRLKNWRGVPTPFNILVKGIIKEIRRLRPFTQLARQIAKTGGT